MGAKTKKVRASGRFGAGYGTRVKKVLNEIEFSQRKKQKCPFCSKSGVAREAMGIWHCLKCGKRFAGHAYSLSLAK